MDERDVGTSISKPILKGITYNIKILTNKYILIGVKLKLYVYHHVIVYLNSLFFNNQSSPV